MLVELADFLMERHPDGTYSNLSDAEMSVNCLDRAWPRSLAPWRAAADAAAKTAPLFGAPIVWGSLPCAYWPLAATAPAATAVPSARAAPRGGAAGTPPILVVGGLHDPATPYQWAVALSRRLSSGVLVSWNGDGHTAYMQGSSCVDNTVDAYLLSLRTPRPGTVCP